MSKKIITKEEFNELSKVMDPLDIIQKYEITLNQENKAEIASKIANKPMIEPIVVQHYCEECGILQKDGSCKNQDCKKSILCLNLLNFQKQMNLNYYWYWVCNFIPFVLGLYSENKIFYYLGIIPNICYLGWVENSYAIYLSINKNGRNQATRYLTHRGAAWSIFFFITSFLTINELWGYSKNYKLQWFILVYWIFDLLFKLTNRFSSTDITIVYIQLFVIIIFVIIQFYVMTMLKSKINSRVNTFINQLS